MNPVINPARTPADQARLDREIDVDGVGRVQVSADFFSLPPDQQQQAVEEIRQFHQSQQPAGAQTPAGPQAPSTGPEHGMGAAWDQWLQHGPYSGPARFLTGAIQGGAHVLDNAAELVEGGLNNTVGRLTGHQFTWAHDVNHPEQTIEGQINPDQQRGGFQGLTDYLGHGSDLGHTVGEVGMSAALTRGLPGVVVPGAASGALMSDAQSPGGVALDALTGGIGGKVANTVVQGVSNIIAPRIASGARRLWDYGVRQMTPGQVAPALRRTEERLMSRPFIGDTITRGRQQSYENFNRAAVEEVVAPYNAVNPAARVRVPRNAQGTGVIRSVGDQLSNRYERLVPKLTLVPDQQLGADIQALGATLTGGDLSPAAVDQFETIVRNQVMPHLNGANPLTGEAYRQIEQRLSGQIARFGRSPDPDHQAMAGAFREVQDAFQAALQRSNPTHAAELAALNESWANLVRVEGAAAGAKGGLFSPQQFRQAVRRADNSVRGRAMARGEARMQDLAEAAVDVLPSQYPDSGTAGRSQMSVYDPRYWTGFAQSRLYTPEVQQGVTNALMFPRPATAQSIAEALRALPAPQAGAAAANALVNPFFRLVP